MWVKIAVAVGVVLVAIAIVLGFVHLSRDDLPPEVVEIDAEHVRRELGDALEMAKAVTIAPHFSGGQMDGFTLLTVKPGSVADRLGLRAGDLLLGVGGIELDAPERALQAQDELKDLRQVDVKMMRNAQVHWFIVRVVD